MKSVPEAELKAQILLSGLSRTEIAGAVGLSYSRLANYLGGFSRMPDNVRTKILHLLSKHFTANQRNHNGKN